MEASVSPHTPIKRKHFLGNNPKALATIFSEFGALELTSDPLVTCLMPSKVCCILSEVKADIFSREAGGEPAFAKGL